MGALGLCCAGLCVLGPVLLALFLPSAMALTHDHWVMGALTALSFGLLGTTIVQGCKKHHQLGPILLAGVAAVLAFGGLTHVLPHLGMAASILLAAAWGWDQITSRRLMTLNTGGREESHGCH
jgi:hypothetical protein